MLQGCVLAVVAVDDAACKRLASPLREARATVSTALIHVNGLATLSAPGFDGIVLDVGADPERFLSLATSLRDDVRTRTIPVVAVVEGTLTARRLAPLALERVVLREDEGKLLEVVAAALEPRRAASAAVEAARELEERQRVALDRLATMRSDAQTMTHDTRVLCGIVLGFAANLRDGVVGSLEEMQRAHVRQIIETANDLAAMLDRFGGGVRAQTTLPAEPVAAVQGGRRVTRRTLLDLSELAVATGRAFSTVAEQKRLMLTFDAPAPVSFWGDGLQVKQVIVNLLVNALKFTPAAGKVTLSVRHAAPTHSGSGIASRSHAELVVRDTGPGIPPEERERIFGRGVRLTRDEKVPGSGLGLAVVREIVQAHGGGIRVEDTPGGGATILVDLPVDMRARREPGILLIDDPEAGRKVFAAIRELRNPTVEVARTGDGSLSKALDGCRAVVVVPASANPALNDLLGASRTPEATSR
jgi:signal transduction histidine kinase